MVYEHTQKANWIKWLSLGLAIYFAVICITIEFEIIVVITGILVIILLLLFRSLTVNVGKEVVKIKMMQGLFVKKYFIKDIVSVKTVRNKWYYGWGIKYWAPKKMWIYGISGLNAVEIKLKSGRVKRIGTDDSQILESEIKRAIK